MQPSSTQNKSSIIQIKHTKFHIWIKKLKLLFFPYVIANIIFNIALLFARYGLEIRWHCINLPDNMYSTNIPLCFSLFYLIKWLKIPIRLSKKQASITGMLYTAVVFWFLYYPAHLLQNNMNSYLYPLITIKNYQQIYNHKYDRFFKINHTSINFNQPIIKATSSYTTNFSDSSNHLHMKELLAIPLNSSKSLFSTPQIWLIKTYNKQIQPPPSSPSKQSEALNQFVLMNQADFSNIIYDNLLSVKYFYADKTSQALKLFTAALNQASPPIDLAPNTILLEPRYTPFKEREAISFNLLILYISALTILFLLFTTFSKVYIVVKKNKPENKL